MKKPVLALALLASGTLAVSSISAQDSSQLPGIVDVSRVQGGTYALDPDHTLVSWRINHFGFNDYIGLFGKITGTIELDPANVEDASFDVTIPIADVTVASEDLREHLLRPGKDGADPDFFGPDPQAATFVSTNVRQTGDTSAIVSGMLTMNGETNPVTMAVNFTGAGTNPMSKAETVGFEARAQIDRTQWGLTTFSPLVGNKVDLEITAAFERQ